jgi:predicted NAD/FAD-dependent oxidoreductase
MARGDIKEGSHGLHNARITLCTSRGKLATQMGPRNQTIPQNGKPFFDYGCQYFTASDPWFQQEVDHWQALGCLTALEDGELGCLSEESGFKKLAAGEKCWVGNGGMGPMLAKIIEDTAKEFQGIVEHVSGFPNESMKVQRLTKTAKGWELGTKGGSTLGSFDFVIGGFAQHCLTDPFLLTGGKACEQMLRCLRRVESNQLIPIQVSFEGKALNAEFTAAHVYGEDSLSFVSNNSWKPQQNGKIGTPGSEHWTLISTASFAEREFNTNPKGYRSIAQEQMFDAFSRCLGISDLSKHRPVVNRINHWEDGVAANTPPNSRGCLFDADMKLGWCGDFCVLPGLEGAALSGRAMATTLSDFLDKGKDFDCRNLLPADKDWVRFQPKEATMVDIGSFPRKLGLKPSWTHTNLVPSAVDGYDPKAHTGAAGQSIGGKGKGGYNGKGSYDGKGSYKGKGSSKGKGGYKGKGYYN